MDTPAFATVLSVDTRPDDAGAAGPRLSRRRLAGLAGGFVASAGGLLLPAAALAQSDDEDDEDEEQEIVPIEAEEEQQDEDEDDETSDVDDNGRYFAETGHNLTGAFLRRWEEVGGEATLGAPLSEERYVERAGADLQTFATITLIHDESAEAPWDVRGMELSPATIRAAVPASTREPVDGCPSIGRSCRYFPERGHTLTGAFLDFWENGGGEPILGQPRSQPYTRNGLTVQACERAILEQRGDGPVRLRRLWAEKIAREGAGGDDAFLPVPPNGGVTSLVNSPQGLNLRSGPNIDAPSVTILPNNAEFIAVPGERGDWVPGYVEGYAGWVSGRFLIDPEDLPTVTARDWDVSVWQGAALNETNVRAEPTTGSPIVDTLPAGGAVTVVDWVVGEEVFKDANSWAELPNGGYVYARNITRAAPVQPPPLPSDAPRRGRWIDINLTQQLMVAYQGRDPVRTVVTITGRPGWETPEGWFEIHTRVANETMDSDAIGAEYYYKLEDVLYTQYFTNRGHAIHYAWWRSSESFGRPGSHGCLNLDLSDAEFFWEWADYGTTLYCHY